MNNDDGRVRIAVFSDLLPLRVSWIAYPYTIQEVGNRRISVPNRCLS